LDFKGQYFLISLVGICPFACFELLLPMPVLFRHVSVNALKRHLAKNPKDLVEFFIDSYHQHQLLSLHLRVSPQKWDWLTEKSPFVVGQYSSALLSLLPLCLKVKS